MYNIERLHDFIEMDFEPKFSKHNSDQLFNLRGVDKAMLQKFKARPAKIFRFGRMLCDTCELRLSLNVRQLVFRMFFFGRSIGSMSSLQCLSNVLPKNTLLYKL